MKLRTAILALSLASVGTFAAGSALADAGQDQLKKLGCSTCHDQEKKKVGPAYKDIQAKYKGQAGAVDKLVGEITKGKPHPKVKATEPELKEAVTYIVGK